MILYMLRQKIKQFLSGEKGDGGAWVVGAIVGFYVVFLIVAAGTDSVVQNIIRGNLKNAANETLQMMKVENGADSGTRQRFNELLEDFGIDPTKVTFSATPKTVQRGDKVEITAIMQYERKSMRLLGASNITVPIEVHASGLAHKYIRDGG